MPNTFSELSDEQKQQYFQALIARSNQPGQFFADNGMRITRVWENYAEGELVVQPNSMNPRGIVHGGCLCSLMDQVAGVAACSTGRACVTINCFINYIRAVESTKKLLCQTSQVRQGKTVGVYNAVLTDDDGRVVASGTFTYYMMEGLTEFLASGTGAAE